MAYAITRMPKLSPHWGVHDRTRDRWCEVPSGEATAVKVCGLLNSGRLDPARLRWLPVNPRVLGDDAGLHDMVQAAE